MKSLTASLKPFRCSASSRRRKKGSTTSRGSLRATRESCQTHACLHACILLTWHSPAHALSQLGDVGQYLALSADLRNIGHVSGNSSNSSRHTRDIKLMRHALTSFMRLCLAFISSSKQDSSM